MGIYMTYTLKMFIEYILEEFQGLYQLFIFLLLMSAEKKNL